MAAPCFSMKSARCPLSHPGPSFLRALETGHFRRVGDNQVRKADVRIICATNCDLKKMVDAGTFRADLYYRINCMQMELPPPAPSARGHSRNWCIISSPMVARRAQGNHARGPRCPDALRLPRQCARTPQYPGAGRHPGAGEGRVENGPTCRRRWWTRIRRRETYPLHEGGGFLRHAQSASGNSPLKTLRKTLDKFGGNRRLAAQALGVSERTLYRKLKFKSASDLA
jgi:hypothetical protein